ncbi:glycosyltransferase family 2 protein [Microbacterium proteolyticum]|uniref:glycosyltransferase family 2 protein n=1 Tax=Microbacterium proteolyticum TaxID=1572644 RepID=UPI0035C0FE28
MSTEPRLQKTVISIATFRRPALLRSLLIECVQQATEVARAVRIVVVDNDPAESAREVVAQFDSVDYVAEHTPGIAAARNRGLDALTADDEAMIFIDDDEIPSPGWLSALLTYADATGADVVTGPVEPLIDDAVPQWILRGGFWRRQSRESGSIPDSVATNNTLMRLSAWRPTGIRFSEALSMKGGSDTEFFRSLRAGSDIRVLWCSDAVVQEHILPARANAKWLFRRAVRIGNINARYRGRVKAFVGGLARVAVGAPYIVIDYFVHRQPMARSWNMLAHGVGMIGNVLSIDVVEYRRGRSGK